MGTEDSGVKLEERAVAWDTLARQEMERNPDPDCEVPDCEVCAANENSMAAARISDRVRANAGEIKVELGGERE